MFGVMPIFNKKEKNMKMNGWIVCLLWASSCYVRADNKVYHMIYAENQIELYKKTYTEAEANKSFLYCIKTDNNLYVADATDKQKDEYKVEPIKLYTPKNQTVKNITDIIQDGNAAELKSYDFESLDSRLMLIGQPIMYKNHWIMPAVVKRKYFGFVQSTDLSIIVKKNVLKYKKEFNIFKSFDTIYSYETDSTEYIVYKVADGYRTLANFVDIVSIANNGLLLRSSSRSPTLKVVDLHNPTEEPTKKDNFYFLDSNQTGDIFFGLEAKISKSFLNKKKIEAVEWNLQKTFDEIIKGEKIKLTNTDVHFLPKIALNADFIYNSDEKIIKSSLIKVLSDKKLINRNTRYKVYMIDEKNILFVPHQTNQKLFLSNKSVDIQRATKTSVITASTFDFTNNRLFFAEYDNEKKDIFIKSKVIKLKEISLLEGSFELKNVEKESEKSEELEGLNL
jgi:hypothetical protein